MRRTNKQNKFLFSIIYPVVQESLTHLSINEIHTMFKTKWDVTKRPLGVPGEYYHISTTRLNVQEFSDYIQRIRAWCIKHLGWGTSELEKTKYDLVKKQKVI